MKLNFVKVNPSGNDTIYIFDPVPRPLQPKLAQIILSKHSLPADQLGYIELQQNKQAAVRLQMMGGEFCGNATRGLGAVLQERGWLNTHKETTSFLLESSGTQELLKVETCRKGTNKFWTKVEVPVPKNVESCSLVFEEKLCNASLVKFPGIWHLVVEDVEATLENFHLFRSHVQIGQDISAFGIMFYFSKDGTFVPYVFVTPTETLVKEGSCGSGSVAVASYLALKEQQERYNVKLPQPEGEINVELSLQAGRITGASISGTVEIVAEGTVWVDV